MITPDAEPPGFFAEKDQRTERVSTDGEIMKRSILLFGLLVSLCLGLDSCANQASSPSTSASTPAGVGTSTESGASSVGGLGAGAAGLHGGN